MTPPKNPAEFRAMAKDGGMFFSTETYTVKRPYQQVVDTFKQRAPFCLNKTIETSRRQGGITGAKFVEVRAWKAKVNSSNNHMECTLQSLVVGGNTYEAIDPPNKDGHYYMLVDAYPVDQGSTRIVVSKSINVSDTVDKAAKNWATGENMGCPDMTQ